MASRNYKQTAEQAKGAFAGHLVTRIDAKSCVIKRPGCSEFWAEAVLLENGGLYIGGDIAPLIFRYGPRTLKGAVHWMASRSSADDSYLLEKAATGMCGSEMLYHWNADVAAEDIRESARDEDMPEEMSTALLRYADGITEDDSEISVYHGVYRITRCTEHESVGRVIRSRVFYVHAALAKMSELLKAKD